MTRQQNEKSKQDRFTRFYFLQVNHILGKVLSKKFIGSKIKTTSTIFYKEQWRYLEFTKTAI
jgi:hypothetical protein